VPDAGQYGAQRMTETPTYYSVPGGDPMRCDPQLETDATEIPLYVEGDDLYSAMLESISRARREIWLESYIFADDAVRWTFAALLVAQAWAGVDVRLHIDAARAFFRGPTGSLHARLRATPVPAMLPERRLLLAGVGSRLGACGGVLERPGAHRSTRTRAASDHLPFVGLMAFAYSRGTDEC